MGKKLTYPPTGWKCPGCDKQHSKPHYSVPGQIDYDKKPGESGRILFNRRKAYNDDLAKDTDIDKTKPMKGAQLDEQTYQRPLYCPHSPISKLMPILNRGLASGARYVAGRMNS